MTISKFSRNPNLALLGKIRRLLSYGFVPQNIAKRLKCSPTTVHIYKKILKREYLRTRGLVDNLLCNHMSLEFKDGCLKCVCGQEWSESKPGVYVAKILTAQIDSDNWKVGYKVKTPRGGIAIIKKISDEKIYVQSKISRYWIRKSRVLLIKN